MPPTLVERVETTCLLVERSRDPASSRSSALETPPLVGRAQSRPGGPRSTRDPTLVELVETTCLLVERSRDPASRAAAVTLAGRAGSEASGQSRPRELRSSDDPRRSTLSKPLVLVVERSRDPVRRAAAAAHRWLSLSKPRDVLVERSRDPVGREASAAHRWLSLSKPRLGVGVAPTWAGWSGSGVVRFVDGVRGWPGWLLAGWRRVVVVGVGRVDVPGVGGRWVRSRCRCRRGCAGRSTDCGS